MPRFLKILCPVLAVLALLVVAGSAVESVALKVPPGFVAEELLVAAPEHGSWSAMTVDTRGRFLISPQGSEPMLRVTITKDGRPHVEKLAVSITSAMGLLTAFDSLYVNGMGTQGFGIYRLRNRGTNDFEAPQLLRKFEGEVSREHGSHGLALGPDGRIYLAQGNHVSPPSDVSASSPYRNYAEDQLLPSANYGLSGGDRAQAPGGHVLRMDPDGRNVELFAAGFRNAYDLAFDSRGELFTFDSDTEASWGHPWYVPSRILHVVPGGDYGFREGTGKWPSYYPDSLPPVVNIGLGSPTGVKFGTTSLFPEKYQRSLFALDWTFGRILAVHLDERGTSFGGQFETFLQGRPLNLTALEFGQDGALYFITGGRRTRSALYRVRYTGGEVKPMASGARQMRINKAPLQTWENLGSDDRFVRHAARIALEAQPAVQWAERALAEKSPRIALTALLALARAGSQADRAAVIERTAWWWPQLKEESLQLEVLRVAALALSRYGKPYPESKSALLRALDASFPASSSALNRELSQILISLDAPQIAPRTLVLIQQAPTFEEQMHYVFHLRHVKAGWNAPSRETYFKWFSQPHPASAHAPEMRKWFADVRLHYADGASLKTYMGNIRKDAAATLSDPERARLATLLVAPLLPAAKPPDVKVRAFVKEWTSAELLPAVAGLKPPRPIERGREVFTAAACISCHRYANEGGDTGPDLTTVAYKLGVREMLESLLEPSKVISDQFQDTIVELADGEKRIGRVLKKTREKITIATNPLSGESEEIPRAKIRSQTPSAVSPMPEGLLNQLSREDILDLLSYLGFGATN